jgi:hypothetical protein
MRFVLDCSVVISWCLPDESNAYADAVLILLSADTEAVVPTIWKSNVLFCQSSLPEMALKAN